MKKKRNILNGIILWALMAVSLAASEEDADAASKASKEVRTSWVKSGSYRVRVKSGKLYKKGVKKAIDSNVCCAYVSGDTVVYNTLDEWKKGMSDPYVNKLKTYNLKTGKKKVFYKDGGEWGGLFMTHYNNGYAYTIMGDDTHVLVKVNVKTGKDSRVKLGVEYDTLLKFKTYKQYLVLQPTKWNSNKSTLCVFDTMTGKTKKIASDVVGKVKIIGNKIYYAVSGKITKDRIGDVTIYRRSQDGSGKKKVTKLKNIYTYSLAVGKTYAVYHDIGDKNIRKHTYLSKKTSKISKKAYNKIWKDATGYDYF